MEVKKEDDEVQKGCRAFASTFFIVSYHHEEEGGGSNPAKRRLR